jgi:hypothetical protein
MGDQVNRGFDGCDEVNVTGIGTSSSSGQGYSSGIAIVSAAKANSSQARVCPAALSPKFTLSFWSTASQFEPPSNYFQRDIMLSIHNSLYNEFKDEL